MATVIIKSGSNDYQADVTSDNKLKVDASGSTIDLAVESIEIGTVDQGAPGTPANAWPIKITDGTDIALVSAAGALQVDGSAVTQPVSGVFWQAVQPISALSLPLPTGAATAANQSTANTSLASIDSKLTAPLSVAQSGTWSTGRTWNLLNTTDSVNSAQSGTWNITNISGTVSLPTGAATAANQATANTSLSSIDSKLTSPLSVAQSGTWNISNVSGTISLPTGAATAAKQPALGTAGAASADVLTVQGIASMVALKVDGSGVTQPVSVASLPLPSGASTSALQATANTSLSSIDSKLTSPLTVNSTLQAGSAIVGKVGIDQTTNGTTNRVNIGSDGTVAVNNFPATQAVSGTVTTNTALQASSAVIGHVIVDSAPTTAVTGPLTDTQLRASAVPVSFTQPALVAGSAIIGKVGIDQTTPGTTNGVQINAALPAGSNVIGHVIVDTAPSTAVTNAGTFAVQATLAAETTKVIGTVNVAASQTIAVTQATGTNLHTVVDSGTVSAAQSGTWTVQPGNTANTTAWKVDGSAVTQPVSAVADFSSTGTLSNVSASASNVNLLVANASRKGFTLYNDSNSAVYVKLGTTASKTSFTIKMQMNSFLSNSWPIYTGNIDALWDSATGTMRVEEFT